MAIDGGYEGEGAFEHGRRAVDEARQFKRALGSQIDELGKKVDLAGRVQRNPVGMVAAALGVGYVLGGGLWSPLTGKLLRVGLRLAILPVIKSQLAAFAATEQP